jgi:hypothetical protein
MCVSTFQTDLNPAGIGEVYVLNDGGEVDLDLGNYERYLNVTLSRDNNITTGKIYREVIEKEVRLLECIAPLFSSAMEFREKANIWARPFRYVPKGSLVSCKSTFVSDCAPCHERDPRLDRTCGENSCR